jgi:multiple sugar transport system permease protein
MTRRTRGQIPLKVMVALFAAMIALLGWNTWRETRTTSSDGREEIVAWGITFFGDEIYTLVHRFEQENPQYKVILSSSAERDTTSDGQRLLSAVAGGVPPDLYFFARFATGEWASRNALTDMGPMLAAQNPSDPHRINLDEYYDWAIKEASYRPPGSREPEKIYSIPTTGDIRMLYCNKDLLRQANLVDEHGEPRAPTTWDELRDYANKLTVYRTPGDRRSGIARLGFAPNYGNSWLYMYAWQAGGELLSPDRARVTFDSPPVVRALRFMADVYDDLGGPVEVDKFRAGQQGSDLDPFLRNLVAMKIDNDWTMRTIADYRPDMDFLVAPAPMPADELAKGRKPITWAGGFSLMIPATAKNKAGAFKLIQYIVSWQGTELLARGKRESKAAEGRMFIPESLANRVQYERLVQREIFDNPRVPQTFKDAHRVMLEQLMPNTLFRPVTPVGQLLWNQHVRAYEAGIRHEFAAEAQASGEDEMKLALATYQTPVQEQLDATLAPPPPLMVKWAPWFIVYGALVVAPFIAMFIAYRRRRREQGYRAAEIGAAMLFVSPWVIGFIVFVGGPILFSILFSFTRYDVLSPARYVGAGNYRDVLRDPLVLKSILNTAFMILRVPLGMAVSLAIALMLNRAVRAIGFYRTAFYMPAIVPMVAGSLLWVWMFNPTQGLINRVLGAFITSPPQWLNDPSWTKPAMILMSLWTAGAGMIIWLAGLQSIPQQLYEAASIDGAGRWRRFVHVTLPMLSPYILFNGIVGLIATMQIFGEAYIMTPDGRPADSTLFYAYYLFKQAFQYFRMGYAAALAWILFLAVLALTLLQLWLGKKWVTYDQG